MNGDTLKMLLMIGVMALCAVGVLWSLAVIVARLRRRVPRRNCAACGYPRPESPVDATLLTTCPECGLSEQDVGRVRRRALRRGMRAPVAMLVLCVIGAGAAVLIQPPMIEKVMPYWLFPRVAEWLTEEQFTRLYKMGYFTTVPAERAGDVLIAAHRRDLFGVDGGRRSSIAWRLFRLSERQLSSERLAQYATDDSHLHIQMSGWDALLARGRYEAAVEVAETWAARERSASDPNGWLNEMLLFRIYSELDLDTRLLDDSQVSRLLDILARRFDRFSEGGWLSQRRLARLFLRYHDVLSEEALSSLRNSVEARASKPQGGTRVICVVTLLLRDRVTTEWVKRHLSETDWRWAAGELEEQSGVAFGWMLLRGMPGWQFRINIDIAAILSETPRQPYITSYF